MLLFLRTKRLMMEAEHHPSLRKQVWGQGRQLLLNSLDHDQEFLFLHWNMLLLAPPTIYPDGSSKMKGCRGCRLMDPDDTPQDSVVETLEASLSYFVAFHWY
jgi:hypothetical protein